MLHKSDMHYCCLLVLVFFLAFSSCETDPELFAVQNLNGNEITVLGHAGMGALYKYPGNTYESIEPLLEIGADGSEVDVQITKDSLLVLFHDEQMEDKTDCSGWVYEYEWAEIGGCRYASLGSHIYVITVNNLFSRIKDLNNYFFSFDCKLFNGSQDKNSYQRQFAYAIKGLIAKYNMKDNIFIETSDTNFIKTIKESGIKSRIFITGIVSIERGVEIAEEMELYGLGIGNTVTAEEVAYAHSKGIRVMLWDAKTEAGNLEAVRKNPDFIQTDKPIHLLKLLGKYKE